jgi:hypothetical protein
VILEPLGRSKWPEIFWDDFHLDSNFKTPEALQSKPLVWSKNSDEVATNKF